MFLDFQFTYIIFTYLFIWITYHTLHIMLYLFYVSEIGSWNIRIIMFGCTEWDIFNAPVFIHFTHEEFPFNCPGDELITKWYTYLFFLPSLFLFISQIWKAQKHLVALTTSKEWDMREEISVSLDLMIIIPMTVNDPI